MKNFNSLPEYIDWEQISEGIWYTDWSQNGQHERHTPQCTCCCSRMYQKDRLEEMRSGGHCRGHTQSSYLSGKQTHRCREHRHLKVGCRGSGVFGQPPHCLHSLSLQWGYSGDICSCCCHWHSRQGQLPGAWNCSPNYIGLDLAQI